MNFLYAFLFGGALCGLAEFIQEKTKLLPIHLILFYVFLGSLLEISGAYEMLFNLFGGGIASNILSFGHLVTHSALEQTKIDGFLGIFTGPLSHASFVFVYTTFISFVISILFTSTG